MRRKMIAAVMAVTMMMTVVACTERGDVQVDTSRMTEVTEQATEDIVGIPNPFLTCETMDEAACLTGFSMTVPGMYPAMKRAKSRWLRANFFRCFMSAATSRF